MQTSATAALRLFGVPVYADGAGDEKPFTAERRFQLLAYLAARRGWLARDHLAGLLWPERSQAAARSNLRKVILLARQIDGLPPVERRADLLRWAPPSDLAAFEAAVAEGRHADALAIYRPPLMQGLEPGLTGGALEWLEFERLRVAGLWRTAGAARLAALRDDPEAAAATARGLFELDRDDETTLLALCEALLALGQHALASRTLQEAFERLEREIGVEPSAALRRMAERVRAAPSPVRKAVASAASGPWVGRRIEIGQLRRLIAEDDCRVLTVTGPPGIGKSALARRAMSSLDDDAWRSAVWVALEDLTDAGQVPARVAFAAGAELDGKLPPWQALRAVLAAAQRLLVLDNAEHLQLAVELDGLLAACPKLRLVVTSRARLGLAGEWLLPLDGLPLPDDDEVDADVLRHCDSVTLFERRALQRRADFDLAREAAAVVELVRLVDGLPLAIELAAAWTHVLPVREIAAELRGSIELLEPNGGRERGLRASFEQSWRLLPPAERDGLAGLALLPGTFDRQMAWQLARAALPVLAALIDKSLLRAEADGRFSLHPLLRQCARFHASDPERAAERHARLMAQRLASYEAMSQLPLAEIERDLPHLRTAWQWAVDHRDVAVVLGMARTFDVFCQQRGAWAEGLKAFGDALAAFDESAPEHWRALLAVLRPLASMKFFAGDLIEADAHARRSLRIARQLRDPTAVMNGLNALGAVRAQQGRFAEAEHFFDHVVRLARRLSDASRLPIAAGNLAVVHEGLGRIEPAIAGYREAIDLTRRSQSFSSLVINLSNLGNLLRLLGRWDDARVLLHEALELCDAHGQEAMRGTVLSTIGKWHADRGEYPAAADWLARALKALRAHGEITAEATTLLAQMRIESAAGRPGQARRRIAEAYAIAERIHSPRLGTECLSAAGELLLREGRTIAGAALAQWAIAQRDMYRSNAAAAQRQLDAFRVPDAALAEARAWLPASATLADALRLARANGIG